MSFLLEKSLILQYWEYALPALISVIIFAYLRSRRDSGTDAQTKLDGEEYIGVSDYKAGNDDEEEFVPALEEREHVPYPGATVTLQGGAEKFYEILNNRRSVRNYSSKRVPFEIIETCIKAAGTAPSGAHTEPWTFCVVGDPDMKARIRDIIEAEEYLNYSQRMHRQWTADLRPLKTHHVKEYLTVAPYLILIFKQIYGLRKDGKRKQHYYNEISVSIATGMLLCALQAAGLNSLVTTPLNCGPALRSLLDRPQNEKLLVLLPVGYAAEDCKVPNIERKDVSEILVKY